MLFSQRPRFANRKFNSDVDMAKPQCSGLASFATDSPNGAATDCPDDCEANEIERLTLTVENWLWRITSEESTIVPFFRTEEMPKVEFKICTKLTEYGGIALLFRSRPVGSHPCMATLIVTASVLTPEREELYVTSKTVTSFMWPSGTLLTLFNPYAGDEECLRYDDLKIRVRISKVVKNPSSLSFPIEVTQVNDGIQTSYAVRESTTTVPPSLGMPKRDRWTDLTLVTDDDVSFQVHRCILAAVSPFFQAMLTTDMAEKGKKRIRLREVGSDALEALLWLIYCSDLKKDLPVPTAVEVYALADRYLMPDLYLIYLDYIEEKMRSSDVTSVLPLLHFHWDDSLAVSALNLVADNSGKVLNSDSWKEAEVHFPELCHNFVRSATRMKNMKKKKEILSSSSEDGFPTVGRAST